MLHPAEFHDGSDEIVSGWQVAREYLRLGFAHIVPGGLDHVLFVLGLYLSRSAWKALLWQLSAFAVAHSLALALSMSGAVRAPEGLVEPLIALSIVYVAIENVLSLRAGVHRKLEPRE